MYIWVVVNLGVIKKGVFNLWFIQIVVVTVGPVFKQVYKRGLNKVDFINGAPPFLKQ